jgi:hypothetical protein
LSGVLSTAVGTLAVSGLWLCLRQLIAYRAERHRWRTVERLVERHGLDVLDHLPELARELREPRPSPTGHTAGKEIGVPRRFSRS